MWLAAWLLSWLAPEQPQQALNAPAEGAVNVFHRHFPNYSDPVAAGPAVLRPGTPCAVTLFHGVGLRSFEQVEHAPYAPPSGACAGPWAAVRLRVRGRVRGVQFDRYGALWLGGVELLRTTTPEPSAAGIEWAVERDLSAYAALFAHPSNATLTIPNEVEGEYTGVLNLSAQLLFTPSSEPPSTGDGGDGRLRAAQAGAAPALPPAPAADEVLSLLRPTHATGSGASRIWNAITPRGGGNVTGGMRLTRRNALRAELHVYASAHGDEEFWYSNVPDSLVNSTGQRGGGAYREVEVFVDGVSAGAAYPFPTIYSGGVCPLLWRPLAGTHSFNLPPLTYDLSPFLPRLNDGETHQITARVIGNSHGGVWYLDPVLLLWHADDAAPLTGRMLRVERSAPSVRTQITRPAKASVNIATHGGSSFVIESEMWAESADGAAYGPPAGAAVTRYLVEGQLVASNENAVYSTRSLTSGSLRYEVTSRYDPSEGVLPDGGLGARFRRSLFEYPYRVADAEAQDDGTMRIDGNVTLTANRREQWGGDEAGSGDASSDTPIVLEWSNAISSNAAYNRSTGPNRTIYLMESSGSHIFDAPAACFRQALVATDGAITHAHFDDGCQQEELRLRLCESFDACAAARRGINSPSEVQHEDHAVHLGEGRPARAARALGDAESDAFSMAQADGAAGGFSGDPLPFRSRRKPVYTV